MMAQQSPVSSSMLIPLAPPSDYLHDLTNSLSPLNSLGGLVPPDLAASIVTSLSGMSGLGGHGVGMGLPLQFGAGVERSLSRNSYSPAMSDSGISVDAASSGSAVSPGFNLHLLAKLGNIGVNTLGEYC